MTRQDWWIFLAIVAFAIIVVLCGGCRTHGLRLESPKASGEYSNEVLWP